MYNSHFGFSSSPFENTLAPRFLFLSSGHNEVISALLFFIREKKSFALVCADVGTGNTMLINHLLSRLPQTVHPIVIANPNVKYTEILRYIARTLNIAGPAKSLLQLIDEVKLALVENARKGRRFVLIIDEAHLLSPSSLEAVRLLSNIETSEKKLLQILLIGQYELSHKLSMPEMRQLRQRINVNRFLSPMSAEETFQYVNYRLKVAGSNFDSCFEPDCKKEIFKRTGGVPRAINRLCDSALLICKTRGGKKSKPKNSWNGRRCVAKRRPVHPNGFPRQTDFADMDRGEVPGDCNFLCGSGNSDCHLGFSWTFWHGGPASHPFPHSFEDRFARFPELGKAGPAEPRPSFRTGEISPGKTIRHRVHFVGNGCRQGRLTPRSRRPGFGNHHHRSSG
jgi:type II secretory pathway predicted ATPase ExeA